MLLHCLVKVDKEVNVRTPATELIFIWKPWSVSWFLTELWPTKEVYLKTMAEELVSSRTLVSFRVRRMPSL